MKILLLCALLCLPAVSAAMLPMEKARLYCDQNNLDRIEGIWEYPQDKVTVLISKATRLPGDIGAADYDITVIDAADASLQPGETLGKAYRTAEASKFRLVIYTTRLNESLSRKQECSATLVSDDYGLSVSSPGRRLSIRFSPLSLIPNFWKIARISVSNRGKEPGPGMIKVYPSYDGNGSSHFSIRYL